MINFCSLKFTLATLKNSLENSSPPPLMYDIPCDEERILLSSSLYCHKDHMNVIQAKTKDNALPRMPYASTSIFIVINLCTYVFTKVIQKTQFYDISSKRTSNQMSITWNAKYLLRIQQQTKIKPLLLIHNKIKICKIDRPFVMKICPFFYNSPLCGDKVRCLTQRR